MPRASAGVVGCPFNRSKRQQTWVATLCPSLFDDNQARVAFSADLEPSTSAGIAPYATNAVRCRCPIGAGRLALAPRATIRGGHGFGQGARAPETRPGQV